uniref:DNA-directed RNA polymerase II subunit 1 n=1 Tax=Tanacetum cinerariifolium TaxID=118510 RepID=A0A6L2LC16_TANCI|nr:DNA-directed RNA polymerase II subunit 1 [Tanacetum cinerariifolium]
MISEYTQLLQFQVDAYFDNELACQRRATQHSGRHIKSIGWYIGTLATGFMKPINTIPPPTPPLHHHSSPPTSSSMIVTPSTSKPTTTKPRYQRMPPLL